MPNETELSRAGRCNKGIAELQQARQFPPDRGTDEEVGRLNGVLSGESVRR